MLELIGKTLLDRYRVEAYIASGGMANVYRGFDKLRNATIALKFMRPDFALDPHFEKKFRAEATTLSRLAHPNIVRYYEIEREDKELFMVMDFIDGVSLQEHLFNNDHLLAPGEVLTIVKPLATALRYAHSKGIIHRDIKPANIMLTKDKQVLLTDFGIAKLVESATVTTVQAGTPAYMSPEQCASRELDHRSDQYSLTVLTYEMLAGRRPFIGESKGLPPGPVAESIRKEHLSVAPDPPSKYNQNLPTVLDQTLLRALSKQPQARYKTTTKFYNALERALQGVNLAVKSVAPQTRESNIPDPKPAAKPQHESDELPAQLTVQRKKGLAWMLTSLGIVGVILAANSINSIDSNTPPVKPLPTPTPYIDPDQPNEFSFINNQSCSKVKITINNKITELSHGEIASLNPPQNINLSNCAKDIYGVYYCQEHRITLGYDTYTINPLPGSLCYSSLTQAANMPVKTPTATPYPQIKVDTNNNLNMRKGPGGVYEIIRSYPNGTILSLHGKHDDVDPTKSGEWYRVSHEGRYGWVAAWLTSHHKGNTSTVDDTRAPPFDKVILILSNESCEEPQYLILNGNTLYPKLPLHRTQSFYINDGDHREQYCTEPNQLTCGPPQTLQYEAANQIFRRYIYCD